MKPLPCFEIVKSEVTVVTQTRTSRQDWNQTWDQVLVPVWLIIRNQISDLIRDSIRELNI